jgi:2-keto-4-pentenoate hydratase/2-oxohepta-3-ene-1,7-dioic acid hydratase in catechol pathway
LKPPQPDIEEAMRFISYLSPGGEAWGALTEAGVVDLARRGFGATLRAAIADDQLAAAGRAALAAAPDHQLRELELLPPIPAPDKILAVGANYADHAKEMSREVLGEPILFSRFPRSLVGAGQPILRPRVSDHLDYEGELAVVIGREGRHIPEAEAHDWIAGYTIFNDGTIRDYQQTSIVVGKNFEASGAMGPWLVTPDDLTFPLTVETRVNGERRQHAATDSLIFSIGRLVEYASRFVRLLPGDVIATGTPAGVGARRSPPAWLAPGDVLEVEISGLGVLRNPVEQEPV